ncbi:MAG: hypothetical protein IJT43_07255 [Stomatobaculum sp.]|nr:hypothetical protein [Stomatobaculum sp.]
MLKIVDIPMDYTEHAESYQVVMKLSPYHDSIVLDLRTDRYGLRSRTEFPRGGMREVTGD